MKKQIQLTEKAWTYDDADQLGSKGGFGTVFRGHGDVGPVAVKQLEISANEAAHREMKLGAFLNKRNLKNVVPVFDYGQDAESDRYFLVMPICEYSLEEFLKGHGPCAWPNAKQIILDVIDGLLEVEDIVHRDLKPGNVLWHNGVWKIADFGIAKFVADSTSLQTLKGSGSPPYAAPEQFRYDSPSAATDVYAIACVIHKIISGNPPFTGDMDAIRQGHLELQSEDLTGVSPRINGLLRSMLRKPQAARPSLQRCRQVIQSEGANSPTSAVSGLAQAGLEVASQEAAKEAQEVMETDKIRLMVEQGDDAVREFLGILNRLLDKITEAASAAHRPYKNAPRVTNGMYRLLHPAG